MACIVDIGCLFELLILSNSLCSISTTIVLLKCLFFHPLLQAVSKISAMFPTVEESHIRDLYKKCGIKLTHCPRD